MDRSVFELFRLDGKVAIVTGAHAWLATISHAPSRKQEPM